MKKLLLTLVAVLGFASLAFAETYTINFASKLGDATISSLDAAYVWDNIKFEADKAEGSTAPAYNKAGDLRLYSKNTLTLTVNGANITKVEFAISAQGLKRLTDVSASAGAIAEQGVNPIVWNGSAATVTFTVTGEKAVYGTDGESKAGQFDFDSVVITTDAPVAEMGEGGTDEPGDEPVVEERVNVSTVAGLNSLADDALFAFAGNAVLSYANGSNAYIQDETGAALVYGSDLKEYANGQVITGFNGTKVTYSEAPEMKSVSDITVGSVATLVPREIVKAEEAGNNLFYYVVCKNVTIGEMSGRNNTLTFSDGSTLAGYQQFTDINWPEAGTYENLYGVMGQYKGNFQFLFVSVDPIEAGENSGEEPGENPGDEPVNPEPVDGQVYAALGESNAEGAADWTLDSDAVLPEGLSYVWSWKAYNNAYYLNGSAYANGTAYAATAYAVSPVIDLTNYKDLSVSFDHAAKFQTTLRDLCSFCVREADAAEWTALSIPVWPEAGSWTFVNSDEIDLNAYAGKKIQLAFKYGSSEAGADTWEIKNFVVKGVKDSGVDELAEDLNAPVSYFNLQGVRVANPAKGLYIRVQGGKATKVIVK